tara:strand:+ start:2595 stop:3299 length:705 start_codon:yes stop_codon:yes gene_type:complete
MSINILILAASKQDENEEYPVCLKEIEGLSVLENIVNRTLDLDSDHYTFAFLETDIQKFYLDKVSNLLVKNSKITKVPEKTKGSACTALLAASEMDPDNELLIVSANEIVKKNYKNCVDFFRKNESDAGTIIFHSIHPRYSYVSVNDDGLITEAAQQKPISNNATAGIFWYKKTYDFIKAAKNIIRKDCNTNGSYYIAPTFNELILEQKKIFVDKIKNNEYIPLKTESQINVML